jgi:hypothetical protein
MKNQISRRARKSDSWGNTVLDPTNGIKGQLDLAKFKKPKGSSFGHKKNCDKFNSEGKAGNTYQFHLIDYRNGNEVLKKSMMSHGDAWKKNQVLAGTGIAWAKCNA